MRDPHRDKPLPCIVCKVQLEPIDKDYWTQPHSGVMLMNAGAYGSSYDCTTIALTVCDECLTANREYVLSWNRPRVKEPDIEWEPFAPWLDKHAEI